MYLIVDLTKCLPSTVRSSIEQAFVFQRTRGLLIGGVVFIAHNGQRALTSDLQQVHYVSELSALQDACQVAKTIANERQDEISIVSYNGRTLSEVKTFCSSMGRRINTFSFSNLNHPVVQATHSYRDDARPNRDGAQASLNLPSGITESEALSCLRRILEKPQMSSGLRQTDLRTHLTIEDQRFQKTNPMEKSFVGGLIRAAEAKGIVRVSREDPINPMIFASTYETCPQRTALPRSGEHVSDVEENGKVQMDCDEQKTQPSPTTRADLFHGYLSTVKLGPYTVCRIAIYQQISEVLKTFEHGCVRDIVSDARKKAESSHLFTNEEARGKAPWKFAARLVETLILKSGSAIGSDGSTIPNGFSAAIQPVKSFVDEWQLRADAELVLSLIVEFRDISQDDVEDVAGVLYYKRDQQEQKRILELVDILMSSGRICEVEQNGRVLLSADTKKLTAYPARDIG
jgi:hypothetical protein